MRCSAAVTKINCSYLQHEQQMCRSPCLRHTVSLWYAGITLCRI